MNMTNQIAGQPNIVGDVNQILNVLDAFGKLLKEETAALKKNDFQTVDRLQASKRALARDYHGLIVGLSSSRENMVKLDMPTREKLVRSRTTFTEILQDNLRALEIAKNSTARLVNKILDAARRAVADDKQTNYSAKGRTQAYKTSTLSLTVDQKL